MKPGHSESATITDPLGEELPGVWKVAAINPGGGQHLAEVMRLLLANAIGREPGPGIGVKGNAHSLSLAWDTVASIPLTGSDYHQLFRPETGVRMAGGLVGLLDDIAALAKAAAASIDDVGVAAGKASAKAVGVVVDDTAVTPAYVHGLAAEREIPIVKRIAWGSLRNKLLFILPIALVLSSIAPVLVEIILMLGGAYLSYEGAHKIHHRLTHREHEPDHDTLEQTFGPEHEEKTVASAIRTDLILSSEIMVISLKEVLDQGIVSRAAILIVVAVLITVAVYGVVGLIVKMDDAGLHLVETGGPNAQRLGRMLVEGMPAVLAVLSSVGTVAMLWVGGHILVAGAAELGWAWPEASLHHLREPIGDIAVVGGVLGWCVETALLAVVGMAVGMTIVGGRRIASRLGTSSRPDEHAVADDSTSSV